MTDTPKAVFLDAGGVLLLPSHDRILGAFERSGAPHVPGGRDIDDAHYRAATTFTTDLDVEQDWAAAWTKYLRRYVEACGTPADWLDEVHRHIDSEFADAALWLKPIPGTVDGLRALADAGVRLGIISNADGLMGQRLAQLEILQVGPGLGVEVETVIDSGAVGVMKPDPRIFAMALDAMGVDATDTWYIGDMPAIDVVGARRAGMRPFVMDPLALHRDRDYDAVASLVELAERARAT